MKLLILFCLIFLVICCQCGKIPAGEKEGLLTSTGSNFEKLSMNVKSKSVELEDMAKMKRIKRQSDDYTYDPDNYDTWKGEILETDNEEYIEVE